MLAFVRAPRQRCLTGRLLPERAGAAACGEQRPDFPGHRSETGRSWLQCADPMPDLVLDLPSLDATRPPAEPAVPAVGAELLVAATPQLRRLVHRVLGWSASASDLDDVVQETLLAAWQHRDRFRGEAALSTWLVRIALRMASRHARRAAWRRRWLRWFGADLPEPVAVDAGAAAGAEATGEVVARTQLAMQKLAHQDREVLVLRYLENRDIPQIAELLGCRRAAIDARLSRARKRLRAVLEGADDATSAGVPGPGGGA